MAVIALSILVGLSIVAILALVPTVRGLPVVLIPAGAGLAIGVLFGVVSLARQRASARRVGWHRAYLVPRELPPPPTLYVGQHQRLHDVLGHLRAERSRTAAGPLIIVIDGEPGVGKSAFAVKAATSAVDSFPNGVVYASLTAVLPRSARLHNILGDVVDSLQTPDDKVPEDTDQRELELRHLSARRHRILYLYDDVADVDALRPLLPASSEAIVLVTTRLPLSFAGMRAEVVKYHIDPLEVTEADDLLRGLLGRPALDEPAEEALGKIVRSAAGYPLALHLAARAVIGRGVWAITEIAEKVDDVGSDDDVRRAARRMLDLSVAVLNERQRHTFFALADLPDQTFVPWMAGELAGLRSEEEAWIICERLADHRLLERVSADVTGVVRLRVPDRVKTYLDAKVSELRPGEDQAHAVALADSRLKAEISNRATRTNAALRDTTIHLYLTDGRIALAQDEARGALADAREAAGHVDTPEGPLTDGERRALAALAEVLAELGGIDDAMEIADRSVTGAEAPGDVASARSARSVGRLYRRQARLEMAAEELTRAAAIATRISDADEAIQALRELAIVQSMGSRDLKPNLDRAYETVEQATELLSAARDQVGLEARMLECVALVRLNHVDRHDGHQSLLHTARDELQEALRVLPATHRLWRAWFYYHLARVVHRQARFEVGPDERFTDVGRQRLSEARSYAQRALDQFSRMNHKYGVARCRLEIGQTYVVDRPELAISMLEDARETFMFCGDRWIEARTALALGRARRSLDPTDKQATVEFTFATRVFSALGDTRGLAEVENVARSMVRLP